MRTDDRLSPKNATESSLPWIKKSGGKLFLTIIISKIALLFVAGLVVFAVMP